MNKLRHPVAAMLLFATLIALLIPVYQGLIDGYGITDSGIKTSVNGTTGEDVFTGNIIEHLNSLRIVEGIAELSAGITKITSPLRVKMQKSGILLFEAPGFPIHSCNQSVAQQSKPQKYKILTGCVAINASNLYFSI